MIDTALIDTPSRQNPDSITAVVSTMPSIAPVIIKTDIYAANHVVLQKIDKVSQLQRQARGP